MKIKRYVTNFSTVSAGFASEPTGALPLDLAGGLPSPDICLVGIAPCSLGGTDAPEHESVL